MFIHLGGETLVSTKNIIIILNHENNTKENTTSEFLKKIQGKAKIVKLEGDSYKAVVITDNTVYLSPISSMTLKKRSEFVDSLA